MKHSSQHHGMTIGQAKKEYNKLLNRFYKAWEWFDRKDIPWEKKEKHIEEFHKILDGLNLYLKKIGNYTEKEMMEGFKI